MGNQKAQLRIILLTWVVTAVLYIVGIDAIISIRHALAPAALTHADFAKALAATIWFFGAGSILGLIPLLLLWFVAYALGVKKWNVVTRMDKARFALPTFVLFPILSIGTLTLIAKMNLHF